MILLSANNFLTLVTTVLCVFALGITNQARTAENVTPSLNKDAAAEVGGQVLHQGTYHRQAAIHLSEEIKFGERHQYSLTPGYYIRTGESLDSGTYAPAVGPDAGRVKKAPGAITLQGSFLYSNDGKTIGVITNFYQAVNAKAKGITRTTWPVVSTESIQRILVYGGKTGTKIKLAYREIWKNITRPSSEVFVEFDLADSKVVEIKGARIEVIEATGKSIQYRVLRPFNSKQERNMKDGGDGTSPSQGDAEVTRLVPTE